MVVAVSDQVGKRGVWRWCRAHPRVTGLIFAALIAVSNMVLLRPAREVLTRDIAFPLFSLIATERAQTIKIKLHPQISKAILVTTSRREVRWGAPVGTLFALAAMFLVAVFPFKKYWLYLLLYHVVLGITGMLLFMVGIAWLDLAFDVYDFSRTYFAETVSIAIPVLLYIAGKRGGALFVSSRTS